MVESEVTFVVTEENPGRDDAFIRVEVSGHVPGTQLNLKPAEAADLREQLGRVLKGPPQ